MKNDEKRIEQLARPILSARLERDNLWCKAICDTQEPDKITGRLVCDVEKLLHQFNAYKRSNVK